jgi:hypothetical protein
VTLQHDLSSIGISGEAHDEAYRNFRKEIKAEQKKEFQIKVRRPNVLLSKALLHVLYSAIHRVGYIRHLLDSRIGGFHVYRKMGIWDEHVFLCVQFRV